MMVRHRSFVVDLVALFTSRFDPALDPDPALDRAAGLHERLLERLDDVLNLEDDRVLRGLLSFVDATVRTNFFQLDADGRPKDHVSVKLAPERLEFLPSPRPLVETYVYSSAMEGLHLRAGRVARGGIRWSDRLDDYRAEVLGLMRAQSVKNSVIVPAGAKGAFVVKGTSTDAKEQRRRGRECYVTFLRGLLDVTDNLVDGRVIHPDRVRRYDDDDTYLVVAADKGTAAFSDLANSVAHEYGYWLGDAFASGGSVGYDHKAMGITARGAWVSVERHLRELEIDPEVDDLTVVGIGDMSGDVFGNGLLRSDRIRLVAAFDHRHVFLDPDPDPAASYAERKRLFDLSGSSWEDYDPRLVSPGGGVYRRTAKNVPVSPEVRRRLGMPDVATLTPDEMIRSILRAEVVLLWNGGVGTYVRASTETDLDLGDKANDPVRVRASELRCRCVAEGGNLGLTQRARIEYALAGGRVNADFVDNSAGVDTSDHEVNLKILLDAAGPDSGLGDTRALLARMEDEVEFDIAMLRHNRSQTLAITLAEADAPVALDRHVRAIRLMERISGLDRALEELPDDTEIMRRRSRGKGLARPEIALVHAWSKNGVRKLILETDLPDDPGVADLVLSYFPEPVRDPRLLAAHPLAREIAATVLADDILDHAGPGFLLRLGERAGVHVATAARAFLVARWSTGADELRDRIDAEPGLPAGVRLATMRRLQQQVEQSSAWLLRARPVPLDVRAETAFFGAGIAELTRAVPDVLTPLQAAEVAADRERLEGSGVPAGLAAEVAALRPLDAALPIVAAADLLRRPVAEVAGVFFALGERLHLDWLETRVAEKPADSHWELIAKSALRDELLAAREELTRRVLGPAGTGGEADAEDGNAPLERWLAAEERRVDRFERVLSEMETEVEFDIAMLTVAAQELRALA